MRGTRSDGVGTTSSVALAPPSEGTIAVPGQTLSWRRAWLPPEPTRSVPWYCERIAPGGNSGIFQPKVRCAQGLRQVSLASRPRSLPWTTMRTATVPFRPGDSISLPASCVVWRRPGRGRCRPRIADAPGGEVRPLSGADEGADARTGYGALRSALPSAVRCPRVGQGLRLGEHRSGCTCCRHDE